MNESIGTYINADKMIEDLETVSQFVQCCSSQSTSIIDSVVEYVKKHRFELTFCKDCKYSREIDKHERGFYFDRHGKRLCLNNCVECTYHCTIMQDCDFCSYGERKEV